MYCGIFVVVPELAIRYLGGKNTEWKECSSLSSF